MRLYFLGICGTAMGHAALLLRQLGHDVEGSDTGVYPPMSDVLARSGIRIHEGWDAARLERLAPDLVVVGNAQSRGHPEVEWLLDTGKIPYTSLPALLSDRVLAGRPSVVVAGTHGKTTTTSIAALLLRANNRDPGWLIGGVPNDLPAGQEAGGAGEPFVIEGDEYDSAFFDKRSKFIHYRPRVLVLNNLEFDHADIFRDLADVQRTFRHVIRLVPRSGWIVANGDDPRLGEVLEAPWTRVLRVGTGEGNDVRIERFHEGPEGARFDLSWKGHFRHRVTWSRPGLYNARNAAMAAVAAGLCCDEADPLGSIRLDRLAGFLGVRRRQEELAHAGGVRVLEDFGHHPTAVAETLVSLRARFPGARLTACFEPRSNTARLKVMQDPFRDAFAHADAVRLGPVHRADALRPAERCETAEIARDLRARGIDARDFADNASLLADLLAEHAKPHAEGGSGHIVVFFSNGAFDGIIPRFAKHVRTLSDAG